MRLYKAHFQIHFHTQNNISTSLLQNTPCMRLWRKVYNTGWIWFGQICKFIWVLLSGLEFFSAFSKYCCKYLSVTRQNNLKKLRKCLKKWHKKGLERGKNLRCNILSMTLIIYWWAEKLTLAVSQRAFQSLRLHRVSVCSLFVCFLALLRAEKCPYSKDCIQVYMF